MSTYLDEYGIKVRRDDGILGKEGSKETMIAFNRANIKRLIQYPSISRTKLRKMLNSEHASQDFRAIVIGYLDKPKDHGLRNSKRKQGVSLPPMVSVL